MMEMKKMILLLKERNSLSQMNLEIFIILIWILQNNAKIFQNEQIILVQFIHRNNYNQLKSIVKFFLVPSSLLVITQSIQLFIITDAFLMFVNVVLTIIRNVLVKHSLIILDNVLLETLYLIG